jgi:hypothetical protein
MIEDYVQLNEEPRITKMAEGSAHGAKQQAAGNDTKKVCPKPFAMAYIALTATLLVV